LNKAASQLPTQEMNTRTLFSANHFPPFIIWFGCLPFWREQTTKTNQINELSGKLNGFGLI